MPYNGDLTNPIMQVRLYTGDTEDDVEFLTDGEYQFLLEKNNGNVNRAVLDAARSILFKLTRYSRERIDDLEIHSGDWFKNYKSALIELLRNPNLTMSLLVPYAGGISKSDMESNDLNSDNVLRDVYIGQQSDGKLYYQNNPVDKPNVF